MKKLPIYISQLLMYILIGVGLYKFINSYKEIQTIIITEPTESGIPIIPLVVVSIVVFILLSGIGLQFLAIFWNWFKLNKTAIMIPILAIIIGVLQLASSLILSIKLYIETNSPQFIANLDVYINSFTSLMWWFVSAIIIGLIGLIWTIIEDNLETE